MSLLNIYFGHISFIIDTPANARTLTVLIIQR